MVRVGKKKKDIRWPKRRERDEKGKVLRDGSGSKSDHQISIDALCVCTVFVKHPRSNTKHSMLSSLTS